MRASVITTSFGAHGLAVAAYTRTRARAHTHTHTQFLSDSDEDAGTAPDANTEEGDTLVPGEPKPSPFRQHS